MEIDKIKKRITNTNYKVKVRLKKLKDDRYSIFLDYHFFENGKELRDRKWLKMYVTGKKNDLQRDRNLIAEAILIRNKYEDMVRQKSYDIFTEKKTITLYGIFDQFLKKQTKKNSLKIWEHAIRHLKIFQPRDIKLKKVTRKFCQDFAQYLLDCPDINQNTAHTYFTRFKIAIKKAYEDDYIEHNLATNIIIRKTEGTREYLTIEELRRLNDLPYSNEDVKNAFIFSCFTGLRLGDLINLEFDDFREENGNLYLVFRDEKTNEYNKLKLCKVAEDILNHEKSTHNSGKVFQLLGETSIRYHIRKMVKKAGIEKHITPHCARHTFATLSISNGIDLYTLAKFLGHNDVKVTQIYAKLMDEKKDEAIDKLPEL